MMSIPLLKHFAAGQIQLDWLRFSHLGLVNWRFFLPLSICHSSACQSAFTSLPSGLSFLRSPPVTHPHQHRRAVWRTGPVAEGAGAVEGAASVVAAVRTFSGGTLWQSPSNMFPAWRRDIRTWSSTVPPRSMFGPRQVGQVWVSFWILLLSTCIPSALAQGKIRNLFSCFIILLGYLGYGGKTESAPR